MRDKIEIQYLNKEAYTMILQKLRQFMCGRYGGDQLCIGLFVLAILCQIVYVFTRFWPLYLLSIVLYGIDIFRILSRNIPKRQAENRKFMNIIWKVKNFWVSIKSDFEEAKTYKRFKCPQCGQKIRIPRGRGKVEICCPKCSTRFIKKV